MRKIYVDPHIDHLRYEWKTITALAYIKHFQWVCDQSDKAGIICDAVCMYIFEYRNTHVYQVQTTTT